MQADSNYIYNKVSKEKGIDLEFLTAVGDFMQKEVANNLRNPDALIIKVKGLGAWHLRKMRLESSYENLSKVKMEDVREDIRESFEVYLARMKARLEDYKLYIDKKSQMKKVKDEYYSKKSSEDNS